MVHHQVMAPLQFVDGEGLLSVNHSEIGYISEIFFLCTHKHTTLTMRSSIMKYFSSSLCTTILKLLLPGAAESSESVTKKLTKPDTDQDSR